jgi:hypothetical protein
MADRGQQRLDLPLVHRAALSLAQHPHQRRAVAIVGLEAPRPQLRARRLRLRGREQPDRARVAPLELEAPRAMQRPGRLDPDHRLAGDTAGCDQPLQLLDARPRDRQRDRLTDQASIARRQPDAVLDLAGIDRHHQPLRLGAAEKYGTRHRATS